MEEYFSYGELEAATKGFAMESLVGKGSHGRVYKAILDSGRHVAVKKASPWLQQQSGGAENVSKLENEVEILASIKSPHVVKLIGTTSSSQEKLLVMEFMPGGSLHDLLHESSEPPAWPKRLVHALQIAQSLQTLHMAAPPVVHRDVKSSNVLLDSLGDAKLADFSLAIRDASQQPEHVPAGTIGYLDPCYTGPTKLSVRNDIYSYGVLLLELICGRQVMDATCDTTSIVAWAIPLVKSGLIAEVCDSRIALPCKLERAIGTVAGLAVRCVSIEEGQRPSAGEIAAELQAAMEQLWLPPMWNQMGSNVCKRIQTCVKVWRMRRRKKVLATRILCENHFLKDGIDDDGHHGNRRKKSYFRCGPSESSRTSFRYALV